MVMHSPGLEEPPATRSEEAGVVPKKALLCYLSLTPHIQRYFGVDT